MSLLGHFADTFLLYRTAQIRHLAFIRAGFALTVIDF